MLFGEQVIEPEAGYHTGTCAECSFRDRDSSEKKLYRCELCGNWFCEKHIRPRTFLVRGLDDVQDEQIPEGLGLNDVPHERTPEQVSFMFGSSAAWIEEAAGQIEDRIKPGKGKQNKWKNLDSHPDFQYTQKWLQQLDIGQKERNELTKRALTRMKRYKLREKQEALHLKHTEPVDKTEPTKVVATQKHFPTKDIGFLLTLLALILIIWWLTR